MSANEPGIAVQDRLLAIESDDRQFPDPRVLVMTGSPALRAGLTAMLYRDGHIDVLTDAAVSDGAAPDVVLLDVTVIRLLNELIDEHWPKASVLLIGEPETSYLNQDEGRPIGAIASDVDQVRLGAAVHAMAAGLVVLDPGLDIRMRMGSATPNADNDGPALTPRERQVLELVARGYPNKSIAYELGISEHTAKFHVGSLLEKLDAASRAEVVTNATRRGVLTV